MDYLIISSAAFALLCLLWAAWIDLKLWILPNELIAAVAILSVPFHYASHGLDADWISIAIGAFVGGGSLWIIRVIANHIYKMETLGFGDIKLMAAVGLWLGSEGVLMALSTGALCGVLHALLIVGYKKFIRGQPVSMARMALPAGPGFILGSLIIAVFTFKELWS